MHTQADISPRRRGIRLYGDQLTIPHADQVHHLQAAQVATTIEVDPLRHLGAQRPLALGLVIEITHHQGIGRIIPLRHRTKGPGRHLAVGVILGVDFRVLLMQGMIGDILHLRRLWLLQEGLEQLLVFNM